MAKPTTSNPFDTSDFMTTLRAKLDRVENDPEFVKELQAEHKGNPMTLGPVVISPEEWAEKQVTRAANAASEWEKNVLRPRRDPIAAAIAAAPKRDQKVRESLEQKKFEKAMAKVDENLMYEVIRKRGAAAFRSGVEDRRAKVVSRVKELQPMVAALKQTIDAMPDVTDADREKRLLAARRGMIEIGKKRLGI
jgi:hypothetical protein